MQLHTVLHILCHMHASNVQLTHSMELAALTLSSYLMADIKLPDGFVLIQV